jgi:hypothetical protein
VYALFEAIIGNKGLEERLQKAAGKKHRKMQSLSQSDGSSRNQDASKRKYDDMAIDFASNAPTPQESYERSRPQTPSIKNEGTNPGQPPMMTSPNPRQNPADTFMGGTSSRPQTRPATPFNPSFSVPATPPDLYLVTRNSPNLSQSLLENFQPDQLFPDSSGMPAFPSLSPTQTHNTLEHNLMAQMPTPTMSSNMQQQQQQQQPHQQQQQPPPPLQQQQTQPANAFTQRNPNNMLHPGQFDCQGQPGMWQPNFDGPLHDGQSPESWSTGSAQGQPVPTALNVEDWFQFFGINGDTNNINLDMPLP